MNSVPTFTILAPVHRPPDLLPFALGSVLSQTRQDFEVFVVCDGAPDATAEIAREFQARDPRVRAFVHPKGERHGEAWRHLALQEARGRIVCQIGDDDLWFPSHLAEVETLMAAADFGCTLPMFLRPDGAPRLHFNDFADPAIQRQMAEGRGNAFGPTPSAYRLETHRSLPQGWSPAPQGVWTDLFMWRKFLALPGIRCATRFVVTSLTFPQALRRDWSLPQRREEIAAVAGQLAEAGYRDRLVQLALAATAQRRVVDSLRLKSFAAITATLLDAIDASETAIADGENAAETLRRLPDRAWRADVRARMGRKAD